MHIVALDKIQLSSYINIEFKTPGAAHGRVRRPTPWRWYYLLLFAHCCIASAMLSGMDAAWDGSLLRLWRLPLVYSGKRQAGAADVELVVDVVDDLVYLTVFVSLGVHVLLCSTYLLV